MTLSLVACDKAPLIDVCVIRVPEEPEPITAECFYKDGTVGSQDIDTMDLWVAMPEQDALDYFRYCNRKGK